MGRIHIQFPNSLTGVEGWALINMKKDHSDTLPFGSSEPTSMRPQLARLAADRDARRLVPHGMQPERARPPALRLGDVFAGHVDEQHAERARAKGTEPREAPARAAAEKHKEPKTDSSDARIARIHGRQHQGAKASETCGACEDEECREEPVVVLSHAGAHPGAVMIEAQEAALA